MLIVEVQMHISILREFVINAVILTPGACGREGLGRTSLRRSGGSAGVCQTSVSSTQNVSFASGNILGRVFWRHKKPLWEWGHALPRFSTQKRGF